MADIYQLIDDIVENAAIAADLDTMEVPTIDEALPEPANTETGGCNIAETGVCQRQVLSIAI